jgi:hypothetical protein
MLAWVSQSQQNHRRIISLLPTMPFLQTPSLNKGKPFNTGLIEFSGSGGGF